MNQRRNIAALAFVIVTAAGCDSDQSLHQPPAKQAPKLSGLPAEVTVKQRSTTVVPESDGLLRVTIDDITRGQVMTSLANKDGAVVLPTASLAAGDSAIFQWGEGTYEITLKELNNALVGEDFATFEITVAGDSRPLTEQAKIERLLSTIEAAKDDIFIRNGTEHTSKDAADHLRTKWKAAGGQIATAEQFIDEIAAKSSLSDEAYRVRQADGTEILAGDYLRKKLSQIETSN